MSRRNLETEQPQPQYSYEQNCAKYLPFDYQNSQRVFKKVSSNNSKKSAAYKNPEAALSNYQTYFVPVSNYDATAKMKQQSIHAQYSYSSNSLYPTYVHDQEKVVDRNKVIYLKYPDEDNLQFKNSKYNSQSNYLLKEQDNFYEYDFVPSTQDYSYVVSDNNKPNYKNTSAQLSKMMYSSYVPEIDVKFANNPNFYYPYSSEPSISSQRSFDDLIDYPVNRSNYKNEEPEKMSASNKSHGQDVTNVTKKYPDILKRLSKSNVTTKTHKSSNNHRGDSIYGTPCNETPTKQYRTINVNTQTSNHNLLLSTEYTQTDHDKVKHSRTKETQTLTHTVTGISIISSFVTCLANKGILIYTSYLRTSVARWLRRILIELAWSVYNCPANCPMQDRIISSYLNHIEKKKSIELSEQSSTSSPSRRSCKKQRMKN